MPAPTATKKATTSNNKERRYLADNYEPHPNDVLIGRGRRVESHNKKFRAMISAHLPAYYNAQTKATKSTIILRIFQQVKRGGGTGFVKQEASSRRWFAIEDSAARISIAQAFRDALSSEYKSSKQYKQLKRKEERGEATTGLMTQMMAMSAAGIDETKLVTSTLFSPAVTVAAPPLPTFNRQVSLEGGMPPLNVPSLARAASGVMPPPPPTSLVSVVSSDNVVPNQRSSLQAILEQANSVVNSVDAESFLRNSAPIAAPIAPASVEEVVAPLATTSQDDDQLLMAGLEQVLGKELKDMDFITSNPFEPTPIQEQQQPQRSGDDLLLGDGDADLMALQQASFSLPAPQQEDATDEDLFQVFDNVPAQDMRHALSA